MTPTKHILSAFRSIIVFGCLASIPTIFEQSALAGDGHVVSPASGTIVTQGSRDIYREQIDAFYSEVYIYVGGSFPTGTDFVDLQFVFDEGNASGYLTPLVFEQTSPGVFTVRGIGTGLQVEQSLSSQLIPFSIVEGHRQSKNANYTFGFINAIVNVSGAPTLTSAGVVDYISPSNGLHGVGGPTTTNDWGATETSPTPIVALGTTFGASGTEYPFTLPYRTYSAFAVGVVETQ